MTATNTAPSWRRRATNGVASVMLACILGAACWAGYLRLSGNIHTVDPGVAYRSAQLTPTQLANLVRDKHLRAVINLRGASPGSRWYDDELAVTAQAGLQHYDLRLSANTEPNDSLVSHLRRLLREVPRPFLLHCEGGADRSGLASALYDLDVRGLAAEVAAEQFTFRYGHFPWFPSKTGAMDRTFWRVADVRRRGRVLQPDSPLRGR